MTARNAKGQFVSDAEHAADLLLERAVAEARRLMQRGLYRAGGRSFVEGDHQFLALHTIESARRSASLLIDRRPAA